jgi:iron complex outermembrane receptor protein
MHRQLPKLMTTDTPSREAQTDVNGIMQLGWKRYGSTSSLVNVIGYTGSNLRFMNPASNLDATTINHKLQFRQDYKRDLGKNWDVHTVVNVNYATATNQNLNAQNNQFDASVLAMLNKQYGKWTTTVALKPGVNNETVYVLPMLSASYHALGNNTLVVGGSLAQNRKFPSLNDLFWEPGGNPDLQPEIANTGELNVDVQTAIKKVEVAFRGSTYYSEVSNWILWKPGDQNYWTAQNVQEVQNYGVESYLQIQKAWNNWQVRVEGAYNWVRAINQGNDANVNGKQLIYTPEHQANGMVRLGYKKHALSLTHNFFGLRYTASDNSDFLPAYQLTNISACTQLKVNKHLLTLKADLNNIFDVSYMAVAWRPMMGFNTQFTLSYSLN